jgi:hypothetical protein
MAIRATNRRQLERMSGGVRHEARPAVHELIVPKRTLVK